MTGITERKVIMSNRYNFDELSAKAMSSSATADDLKALAEWFDRYDTSAWNGECYDIDGVHSLYPIYAEAEDDEYVIVDYEVR